MKVAVDTRGENFLLEWSWLFIQSQVSALPLCIMAYCMDADHHLEMTSSGQTVSESCRELVGYVLHIMLCSEGITSQSCR